MAPKYAQIIKRLGPDRVKQKEPLAGHTSFKIGGPADLFYEATSSGQLVEAVELARELKVPYFVLGGGSNLLVADAGFKGWVIKAANNQLEIKGNKVLVGAGVKLADLLEKLVAACLTGLEFVAGIPGSVGGAIWGNAGAWQQTIGDRINWVEILDRTGKVVRLRWADCAFAYRQSRFKTSGEVILRAGLELEKGSQEKIRRQVEANLAKRQNQPKQPSAGCIFTNPKPEAAGTLIEQSGLKGKQIGGAQISPLHANFIVNTNGAKAEDVLALIRLAQQQVKAKFGIELEKEIFLLGFAKIEEND